LVLSVLNSSRSTDIPSHIQNLDSSEQVRLLSLRLASFTSSTDVAKNSDVQVLLMKYLYKAMENLGDSSGNAVLGWHEKVS